MKAYPNMNNWKFKKLHKPNKNFMHLVEKKLFLALNSEYALQAAESGKLTFKQIESCRRALRRTLGKSSQIYFNIFTSIPVSKKPIASRMGKGKGLLSHWIAVVKEGKILVEVNSSLASKAYLALLKASTKLPIKTKILNLKF